MAHPDTQLAAFLAALHDDSDLTAAVGAAADHAAIVRIAADRGFTLADTEVLAMASSGMAAAADSDPGELSDAELESVSGGYTFPQTDWIYCDNPWTNYYCTMKC